MKAIKNRTAYIEEVYTKNYHGLLGFAIKCGCRSDEAPDIVQTAISKFIAYMKKNRWKITVEKPFSFLAKTVSNLVIDKARHEKVENSTSLDAEDNFYQLSDNGSAIDIINFEIDELERFEKELGHLMDGFSDYEKELGRLHVFEKRKPHGIARILNQSYEKTFLDCGRVKAKLRGRSKSKLRNMQ